MNETASKETTVTDVSTLPPLITTGTAAALLSCSAAMVRRMCASGELKASKIGVDWRVNTRDLLERFGLAS